MGPDFSVQSSYIGNTENNVLNLLRFLSFDILGTGDLVSDGREVVNTGGIQNPHFGITKDGDIFVG